jgi:hypothetical protein
MIGNKIRQGKIWCKSTVKNRFGSGYTHKKLKSNWIQMVRDHDEPLEVYVSRKLEESDVGQSDNSKAIDMINNMLNGV